MSRSTDGVEMDLPAMLIDRPPTGSIGQGKACSHVWPGPLALMCWRLRQFLNGVLPASLLGEREARSRGRSNAPNCCVTRSPAGCPGVRPSGMC
jgi:hypothetical protein